MPGRRVRLVDELLVAVGDRHVVWRLCPCCHQLRDLGVLVVDSWRLKEVEKGQLESGRDGLIEGVATRVDRYDKFGNMDCVFYHF